MFLVVYTAPNYGDEYSKNNESNNDCCWVHKIRSFYFAAAAATALTVPVL